MFFDLAFSRPHRTSLIHTMGHWLHFPDQCTVLNDISYFLQSVTVFDIADRAGLSKDLVLMDDLCIFVDYLVLDDDILCRSRRRGR